MRWALAPEPKGSDTLDRWLDKVAKAYGFSGRNELFTYYGIASQNLHDLRWYPSDQVLSFIQTNSTLSHRSILEMTGLCAVETYNDPPTPKRLIGCLADWPTPTTLPDMYKLRPSKLFKYVVIKSENLEDSYSEIGLHFQKGKPSNFRFVRIPAFIKTTANLVDFTYFFIINGQAVHFLENNLVISSRASFAALKLAYLFSLYRYSDPEVQRSYAEN